MDGDAQLNTAHGGRYEAGAEPAGMPAANDAGRGDQPRYTTSDVDYEKKYAPDAYGEEMSSKARVWSVYNDETQIVDGERVKALNGTLDVLLVFVRRPLNCSACH